MIGVGKHSFEGDQRPAQLTLGWAPGNYTNGCSYCGDLFTGDKMAGMCADCAYGDTPDSKLVLNHHNIPFRDEISSMNILFFGVFGSQLYGTDTPESDRDFKGIYMPTGRQFIFGEAKGSIHFKTAKNKSEGEKNSADDVDIEILSLPYFIELALKGETMAIDMLHTPEVQTLITSDIWDALTCLKTGFYTKNLSAFIQYARKQAAKYGIKGSRLSDMKAVLEYAEQEHGCNDNYKLSELWSSLPQGEHITKIEPGDPGNEKGSWRLYQVCGQKFQETVRLTYLYDAVLKKYAEYGERARLAESNEGVDWKAISHALRACYQLKSIYSNGGLTYPLAQAKYLRDVKSGKFNYKDVAPVLESNIETVELLAASCSYPDTPNVKEFKDLLYYWCAASLCEEVIDND